MARTISRFNQTNKVVSLTDGATINIDCDAVEIGTLTLTQNCTIATPTGNPVEGQLLLLVIKSASAFVLTFDTGYETASSLSFPSTTTGGGKIDKIGFRYSAVQSKWIFDATTIGAYPTALGLSFAQTVGLSMFNF